MIGGGVSPFANIQIHLRSVLFLGSGLPFDCCRWLQTLVVLEGYCKQKRLPLVGDIAYSMGLLCCDWTLSRIAYQSAIPHEASRRF